MDLWCCFSSRGNFVRVHSIMNSLKYQDILNKNLVSWKWAIGCFSRNVTGAVLLVKGVQRINSRGVSNCGRHYLMYKNTYFLMCDFFGPFNDCINWIFLLFSFTPRLHITSYMFVCIYINMLCHICNSFLYSFSASVCSCCLSGWETPRERVTVPPARPSTSTFIWFYKPPILGFFMWTWKCKCSVETVDLLWATKL